MNKQTSPLVSIVLCVYNGEKYLQEQLDSVLNQSYANFELLLLDDQSTDTSLSILKSYEKKHACIRLIQNDTNLGFNKNFEKGILLSRGELISICDQDDVWLPDKINDLVSHIKDAKLIYSNSELIDEQGVSLNMTLEHNIVHVSNPTYKAFLESNFITGHTCLFKRELIPFILPLPYTITYYDKWIGMVASYVGKVYYFPKILTKYRVHRSSVMQQQKYIADKPDNRQKAVSELEAFSEMNFVRQEDRLFIHEYLQKKRNAKKGIGHYICYYLFLYKNHSILYPWYAKPFLKKLNFLRKQCL